ncbi:MAG: M16 family metallopeptidase [Bacteroidota bacterium]|jgi:zinc protease
MKILMKRISISAILILFISHAFASAVFQTVTLPNPQSDKIVVKMMFRNGSMSDPKGMEGITQLTSSLMLDGGTGKFSASDIKSMTYPWAARWYSTVDKEVTVFTFEFHKDHAEQMLSIMTGLVVAPAFSESDYKRIKSNQENYINEVIRSSSDEELSKYALESFLFRDTRYAHPIGGTSQGLTNVSLEEVVRYHKASFTTRNLMLGIAGAYTDPYLLKLQEAMMKLPDANPSTLQPVVARNPKGLQVEIITKQNTLGSAIFAGFPLEITRSQDEFAALMVANSWLGEHRKSYSRLYQKIREQRSMNYGDYTYIEWYENGGSNMLPQPGYPRKSNYFSIWLRPVQTAGALKSQYPELKEIKIGHAHFALRMALRELQTMVEKGMTHEDFELTRDFLRSYTKLYIQTPAKQLGFLMDSKFYGRNDFIGELDVMLERLSLDDVNAAIQKHWQSKNMFITIVTDKAEAEPLKESLMNGLRSPMSYADALRATLPPEILAEDEDVSNYPMQVTSVEIISDQSLFR